MRQLLVRRVQQVERDAVECSASNGSAALARFLRGLRAHFAVTGENCPPKLNPIKNDNTWLEQPGSAKAKLANEKPHGETVPYETLVGAWREGRVR